MAKAGRYRHAVCASRRGCARLSGCYCRTAAAATAAATAADVASNAVKVAQGVAQAASETASRVAELATKTSESVLLFGQDISYIKKDISEIKSDLKEINSKYISQQQHQELVNISSDHETRIRGNEKMLTQIATWGTVGMVAIGIIETLITRYAK